MAILNVMLPSGRARSGGSMQCQGGESTIQTFSEVLLWLFVINLGIAFGAGFYNKPELPVDAGD